jgi:hypothetical protein
LANIKKYDYVKICGKLGLVYLKEKNPYIYVLDGLGFEHKITRINLANGSKLTIKSLLDKNLINSYFLMVMSIRHKDVYTKSSFEKFNYDKALTYTTATCLKHGDYRTKPNWLMSRGHHCERCKGDETGIRLSIDTTEFIKRAKKYHGDRYDYSKTLYSGAKNLVTVTCRVHGDFEIVANYHSGDTCGCQKCGLESGGYSRGDYASACPNGSYVYVMSISNREEVFLKIGISKNPKSRASALMADSGYSAIVDCSEYYRDATLAWDTELFMHRGFKEHRYKPKKYFAGHTECFDLGIKDEVIKLLQCVA